MWGRTQPYRVGAKLHPLTIEQNAQTSFKSSFIPTIPGRLFFLKELAGPLVPDIN